MLELHVTDTNVSGGSIKVSWCLTKEALKELADRKVKDPFKFQILSFTKGYVNLSPRLNQLTIV